MICARCPLPHSSHFEVSNGSLSPFANEFVLQGSKLRKTKVSSGNVKNLSKGSNAKKGNFGSKFQSGNGKLVYLFHLLGIVYL